MLNMSDFFYSIEVSHDDHGLVSKTHLRYATLSPHIQVLRGIVNDEREERKIQGFKGLKLARSKYSVEVVVIYLFVCHIEGCLDNKEGKSGSSF